MKKFRYISLAGFWILSAVSVLAQGANFAPTTSSASSPNPATTDTSAKGIPGSTPPASSSDNSSTGPKPPPLSASTLTSMDALDDKITLDIGDTLSFRVIEDRDDAVTRIVTDSGEVDFPYVGRVKVAGKTCHQVASELKKLLEVDYYKRATVIVGLDVISAQNNKTKPQDLIWLIGEVRSQGPQELSKLQPMTVSQIILRAGGFTDFANREEVKIIHHVHPAAVDGTTVTPTPDISKFKDAQIVNVKSIFNGHGGPDPIVQPDDYIIVARSLF